MARQPMSMEAMLDEERREVLALLEGPSNPRARPPSSLEARSPSPYTPRSPVRSMLDIGDAPPSPTLLSPASPKSMSTKTASVRAAPVRSMLDVDSPPSQPVRSMLDVDSPPPAAKQVFSTPSSPTESSSRAVVSTHPRSMSDASVRPVDFGPRLERTRVVDPTTEYQFSGIITNTGGQALPKRVTQGGKRSSAMAEIMRGNDVSGIVLPGDRGRHHSASGPSSRLGNKSKSPHNRLSVRSHSPHGPLLRTLSPAGRAVLNDPEILDYNNAYRRLSDAALARSGGSLSELGRRKSSNYAPGSGRLAKDYLGPDGEVLVEDSSEDDGSSSGEEGQDRQRGRKADRSLDNLKSSSPDAQRQVKSLLAAAEEERIQVAAQQPAYQYKSLLDEPEITVTNPSGERVKHSKSVIHPTTSFDDPPGTGTHTPIDSDTEADLTDIKRAQKLSFAMTQIMDTPEAHRTIQIITRGEYAKLVQDAEEEHRSPRKYLVATDLSEESTHALEWAIGTVLRDGDTLLAIYCVDEETGIGAGDNAQVPDEPRAMKEQAAAINTVTASTKLPITPSGTALPLHNPQLQSNTTIASTTGGGRSPLLTPSQPSDSAGSGATSSVSPAPSMFTRERSKAEDDRYTAVQAISDRVTKLLRKTRLQVRVIVEVLHCKNPKHLITEVIDLVNPTLVILGSRGRSALKGVILGSFSNYLVTKSSVPVMVARKRLKKQGKYKRVPSTHQVNNIHNPAARSLANAKID
ncbi:adenine nucleotide alpha hydrolases-like protein [Parathielavia appendiculata]|uniref:Adenine nucleotide alpha hydrolases-like protein n=1 Tax=Parathielavia appendiculata TaxID=2587402 RepID=A0AAN6U5K4_9PEZI|nr:adenine nucleotide alpha hydrolases-like protein [Parathielavia appendiculata]